MSLLARTLTLLAVFVALGPLASQAAAQDAASPPRVRVAQAAERLEPPFARRVPAPSLDGGAGWLNTTGPLDLKDLRGKIVLLDFWTYCCINCIHVLPELKKLEHAYPNELVVIGVHSAKFETEQDTENIREAILRYEIEHPVINDSNHVIWRKYSVSSWPTMLLIDPEGYAVWARSGEATFEQLNALMQHAIPYYRQKGLINATPLKFNQEALKAAKTPLRFPGKVLADEASERLFIADSNHNRIIITDLEGKLLEVIGTGQIGRADGGYAEASFDHPQGMALAGEVLYVADTENHLLRKIDLKSKQVSTIAGTGVQGRQGWPGISSDGDLPRRFVGPPQTTPLNSPWAVLVHEDNLYIAMAGPHQIWKMTLDEKEIGPYAGNGREDIVDGPLLPPVPYEMGYSSFAQPSGLASDGTWLYVADSEGSSVRAVPFNPRREVKTIVGTADLPYGRLFEFGDVDGRGDNVRLQHVLGVVYYEGQLYIADTYNNKIKVIDPIKRTCKTLVGTGEPGKSDEAPTFDEPAGITAAAGKLFVADTNNHLIRVVDLRGGNRVSTLTIEGLTPPEAPPAASAGDAPAGPAFAKAVSVKLPQQTVRAEKGKVTLRVELGLPVGWKINPLAPQRYQLWTEAEAGPVERSGLGKLVDLKPPATTFDIEVPVTGPGEETLRVAVQYYYCQHDGGLCKTGTVAWTVPLRIADDAQTAEVPLEYRVAN